MGGEIFGDNEISLSKFRFLPQIFGERLFCSLGAKNPRDPSKSPHKWGRHLLSKCLH